MLRHKNIDKICSVILAITLVLTCVYTAMAAGGLFESRSTVGYAQRLFDQSSVHTIDIVIDDWDAFLENCTSEEYSLCSVVIDGEKYASVAIRGKGNTSLSQVKQYGNNRYSFKIEFDHYQKGKSYYGLDKLCLNNIIQDKTYMKDYLAYTLMNRMGVPAPLCSFVQVNVNGEYWGLYLAVEAVEDGFLTRTFNSETGDLYKPDSTSMGGGRGNGREFDMDAFRERFQQLMTEESEGEGENSADAAQAETQWNRMEPPEDMESPDGFDAPEEFEPPEMDGTEMPEGFESPQGLELPQTEETEGDSSESNTNARASFGRGMRMMGGGMGGMGSSDVKLQYTDDEASSYSNIFENAKTDVSESDEARLIEALKALNQGEDPSAAVNVDEVIRYFVVHSFLVNGDSYTGNMIHNYYLYEDDGVLSMIPWDYNLCFGTFSMGGSADTDSATAAVNDPVDTPVSGGDVTDRPMLAWIFADEAYTEQYHEVYREFMESVYESGWLAEEIERVADLIAPFVETDPTAFFTYEEFQTAVEALKAFCELRCESVEGQLDGSIPSTSTAQSENREALIDASSISLSDMGNFQNGGNGGERGQMGGYQGGFGGFGGNWQRGMGGANRSAEANESMNGSETTEEGAGFTPQQEGNAPPSDDGIAPTERGGDMSEQPSDMSEMVQNEGNEGSAELAPLQTASSDSAMQGSAMTPPDGDSQPPAGNGGAMPDLPNGIGGEDGNAVAQQTVQNGKNAWIWLGASALLLVCGLVFAGKAKRYN